MFNRFYTTQRFKSQILGKKNGNRGVLPYKIKKGFYVVNYIEKKGIYNTKNKIIFK